jgi:hypothetical protein
MADTAGRPQEQHRRRNFARHNHGVVPGAAHHAMQLVSGRRHRMRHGI